MFHITVTVKQIYRKTNGGSFQRKRDIVVGDEMIRMIKYTDDQAVVAESEGELEGMMNIVLRMGKEFGMKIILRKQG